MRNLIKLFEMQRLDICHAIAVLIAGMEFTLPKTEAYCRDASHLSTYGG